MRFGKWTICLIALAIVSWIHTARPEEREVIFSDDFSAYSDGAGLSGNWSVFSGKWYVKDGVLHQEAPGYDHGIGVRDLFLRCDYRIEAKVQLVDGGGGAGLYWNVGNVETGDNSDMLRFDGEGPLMYGYMYRRLFIRTPGSERASIADKKWHTMRLDVHNSKGTWDFHFDGKKIIDGAELHFRSGYPSLQCSLGHCKFDDVTISVARETQYSSEPKYVVTPKVSGVTYNSAIITWRTNGRESTRLWLAEKPFKEISFLNPDFSGLRGYGDGRLRTRHRAVLKGLKPGTEYSFSIAPTEKEIEPEGYAVDYRFVTKAPKGMMAYREVPLAVLCYMHVTHKDAKKPDGTPADPTLRDEKWFEERIKHAEAMRYFYLVNTMFRLDTKCHYLKVTRPVDSSKLGNMTEEVSKDLEALAARDGMKPEDFGAVLVVGAAGTYAYPWPTPWWDGKLDYTTGCCFVGWGDTWIDTHEFHHLTEGWMSMVGHSIGGENGYGHADQPWKHPGRFGENFDYLAHTLRYVPPETYLKLGVGYIRLTEDGDGDGVPDDEPNIIFDEKRGGTDPKSRHSYRNGLTDLQNLTAEFFNPAPRGRKHPLLKKKVNLKHPFAVFDYDYKRKKKTPIIDGVLKACEWDKFASTPNAVTPTNPNLPWGRVYPPAAGADYRMDTFLNWDDDNIYVAASAPYKFAISVQLDGGADGYFSGKENPRLAVHIPKDEKKNPPNKLLPPPGVMVWNNAEPVLKNDMPVWTNELFDTRDNVKWAWGKNDRGWYEVEIAFPKCENIGLVPKEGNEMGVRFWIQGFLPPTEENRNPHYAFEMFEACEYGYFKLVK